MDPASGFPLWRGEPVREDRRWVVGPLFLTEPEHKVPEVGHELTLTGQNPGAKMTFKVLDVQSEGDEFLLLAEVIA